MARLVWTLESERWLKDIFEYIALDNPDAAEGVVAGFMIACSRSYNSRSLDTNTRVVPPMSVFCYMVTIESRTET
jgi:hypothetical protein